MYVSWHSKHSTRFKHLLQFLGQADYSNSHVFVKIYNTVLWAHFKHIPPSQRRQLGNSLQAWKTHFGLTTLFTVTADITNPSLHLEQNPRLQSAHSKLHILESKGLKQNPFFNTVDDEHWRHVFWLTHRMQFWEQD